MQMYRYEYQNIDYSVTESMKNKKTYPLSSFPFHIWMVVSSSFHWSSHFSIAPFTFPSCSVTCT